MGSGLDEVFTYVDDLREKGVKADVEAVLLRIRYPVSFEAAQWLAKGNPNGN